MDGDWGWRLVETDLLFGEVLPKLHDYESMTWSEVEGRSGSHFVSIDDLCTDAQRRLEYLQMDDFGDLFSLRITGSRRVWGWRDVAILRVLWWDPHHQVCPALKRHT